MDRSWIFFRDGEGRFRELEKDMFQNLWSHAWAGGQRTFIAVGAGYEGEFPEEAHVLWVKRDVDLSRFIFANRPSLDKTENRLTIPRERFEQREKIFARICHEEIVLAEGLYDEHPTERLFFTGTITNVRCALTIPRERARSQRFTEWLEKRDSWNLSMLECRDDVLSLEDIDRVQAAPLQTPLLYSFRAPQPDTQAIERALKCKWIDWDLGLGEPPPAIKDKCFFSLHSSNETFEADLQRLSEIKDVRIKWAPFVTTFSQLQAGHEWYREEPGRRAFLPQSTSGRWSWYRRLHKERIWLQFVREGAGSANDQPTLLQWLSTIDAGRNMAVLGSPVVHSWSPEFHRDFSRERKMNFSQSAWNATKPTVRRYYSSSSWGFARLP